MDFVMRKALLFTHIGLTILSPVTFGYGIQHGIYQGAQGRKIQSGNVLDTSEALSTVSCAVKCGLTDGCASIRFEPSNNVCLLSHLTTTEIQLYTDAEEGWESYSRNDWLLAFRAPNGIGGDVYTAFVDGVGGTTDRTDCTDLTSTGCQSYYRHPIVDNWAIGNITKVRLSFYKNQVETAYAVFQSSGSNSSSWFEEEKIIESTWTVNQTIFSMGGVNIELSFVILVSTGDCQDTVFTLVIQSSRGMCNFDEQTTYPQFFYATTQCPGYPDTGAGLQCPIEADALFQDVRKTLTLTSRTEQRYITKHCDRSGMTPTNTYTFLAGKQSRPTFSRGLVCC